MRYITKKNGKYFFMEHTKSKKTFVNRTIFSQVKLLMVPSNFIYEQADRVYVFECIQRAIC